jgi:hypothetical protein
MKPSSDSKLPTVLKSAEISSLRYGNRVGDYILLNPVICVAARLDAIIEHSPDGYACLEPWSVTAQCDSLAKL